MKILTLFSLVKHIRSNLFFMPPYLPHDNYNNFNNNNNNNLKIQNNLLDQSINNSINNSIDNPTNNFKNMNEIIKKYTGSDWRKYIENVDDYEYKKIKIPLTNDKDLFDLYLICWGTKAFAPIHDHSNIGCHLFLLQGKLNENLYSIKNNNFLKTNLIKHGDTSFINNNLYYHSICNESNKKSYSLHIYSPPNYKTNYISKL